MNIKSFRNQFCECKLDGMNKPGPIQKFKDHPEMLPHPMCVKASKAVAQKLKEDPEFGLTPLLCLRFGGECSSGNPGCMNLRGFPKEEIYAHGMQWPTGEFKTGV